MRDLSTQRASCASNKSRRETPHSLRFTRATHFLALPSLRAGSSKRSKDKTHLFHTEICKHFLVGTCTRENCTFAHDYSELRPISRPPNYKTLLCKHFAEKGKCKWGHRCNFSHGVAPPHAPQAPPEAPPQAPPPQAPPPQALPPVVLQRSVPQYPRRRVRASCWPSRHRHAWRAGMSRCEYAA